MSMLSLSDDRIDLWIVLTEEVDHPILLTAYEQLLSPQEIEEGKRFCFEKDRVRNLISKALVRTVLSKYAPVKPQEWTFCRNPFGCPQLTNSQTHTTQLSFNVSHTAGLTVVGVTHGLSLGVDVENVERKRIPFEIADHFFATSESASLRASPLEDRGELFWAYWTLKESYVKAKRRGLSMPLNSFSFELTKNRGIHFSCEHSDNALDWCFWQIRPTWIHRLAVCAKRSRNDGQRLVTRKIVPLRDEGLFDCEILLESR
jgi:4'-phosphopantetheinyl transferase